MSQSSSARSVDQTDLVRRFAALVQIVHHVPGRVRFKLAAEGEGMLATVLADAQKFSRSIAAVPGIRSIKFNALARSCVVEYDPARIPPPTWPGLVAGRPSAEVDSLLAALAAPAGACGG